MFHIIIIRVVRLQRKMLLRIVIQNYTKLHHITPNDREQNWTASDTLFEVSTSLKNLSINLGCVSAEAIKQFMI